MHWHLWHRQARSVYNVLLTAELKLCPDSIDYDCASPALKTDEWKACMCKCMYACMQTHTHTHTYTQRTHTCMHTCVCALYLLDVTPEELTRPKSTSKLLVFMGMVPGPATERKNFMTSARHAIGLCWKQTSPNHCHIHPAVNSRQARTKNSYILGILNTDVH